MHITHDPYYRDRLTVRDLCHDFPGDEIFIDGLHAMQSHFCTNNVPIDIPIVRVMNAAHFLAAYMFSTTCSGDQGEYDALTYGSVGHDKQVMLVTLIVLAAILKRTEGLRARVCHNMLLEDRSEDFYDGVSLYDQFLRSAEKHFAEEDFLLDTHQQIVQLQEEKIQQITINTIIQTMNVNITNLGGTINNNSQDHSKHVTINVPAGTNVSDIVRQFMADDVEPVEVVEETEQIESIIFTPKAKKEGKISTILQALQKSVQGRKDKTRAFVHELQTWQKNEYVDAHYNAQVMYDELAKILPLPFGYEVFKKHYNNTRS